MGREGDAELEGEGKISNTIDVSKTMGEHTIYKLTSKYK